MFANRAAAGNGRKPAGTQLDGDGARTEIAFCQTPGNFGRLTVDNLKQHVNTATVNGKGGVLGEGATHPATRNLPVVNPYSTLQKAVVLVAKQSRQNIPAPLTQLSDGKHASQVQPAGRSGTNAPQLTDGQGINKTLHLICRDMNQTVGLVVVGGNLGQQLVVGQAHGCRQAGLRGDLALELQPGLKNPDGIGTGQPGDIDKSLIQAQSFNAVADLGEKCEYLLRHLAVALKAGLDEHARRAQSAGPGRRHGRMHSILPRFVAGRSEEHTS